MSLYLYRMTRDTQIYKTVLTDAEYKTALDTGYVPPCIGVGSMPIEDSCESFIALKDGPNDSLLNFEEFRKFQEAYNAKRSTRHE